MSESGEQSPVRALALVGMPGAGKSICAAFLREKGYESFRFGSVIINELKRRGLPITPENEREIREEMRAAGGMAVIARRALPILQRTISERGSVVMDGLYSQSEYLYLREALGVKLALLAIVAPRSLRYERLAGRSERLHNALEAEKRDLQEIATLEKGGPIAMADYTIINDGTVAELRARMEQALQSLHFVGVKQPPLISARPRPDAGCGRG